MTSFISLSLSIKQQLLTHHYDQSAQATFILDADKRYLSVNSAYEKLTGYSAESLAGEYFGTFATQFLNANDYIILQNLASHLHDNRTPNQTYKQSFTLPNTYGQKLKYPIVFSKIVIDTVVYFIGSITNSPTIAVAETKSIYSVNENQLINNLSSEPLLNDGLNQNSTLTDKSSTNPIQQKLLLSQAISAKQFEAYYQPKVKLDTGDVVGFEALVRWQHPTRGLLQPKDFIDDIIQYNLSLELFCLLSEQIAQLLVDWRSRGFTQHICINADAAEFSNPKFNSTVRRLLHKYNLAPYQLHIEMTESSLLPCGDDIKQRLIELKESKICLALDDFGTGYASLSYLQSFPFDYIKVDKSFISELSSNKTQQVIVQAIIDLAKALDLEIVAEGIETKQQYTILQEMGCSYGQGYWLGHPVSAESVTQMLSVTKI